MGLWPDWLLLHLHINDDITFLLSQTVPVVDSDKGCFIHFKRHLLFFQIAAFLDNLPVVDLQSSLFCHFLLLLSCSLSCQWQLRDVNPPRKNHCQISHWLRSAQIWNSLHWIKIHIWILLIVWICCDDDFYFNLLCQMRECMKCLWELPVEGLGRRSCLLLVEGHKKVFIGSGTHFRVSSHSYIWTRKSRICRKCPLYVPNSQSKRMIYFSDNFAFQYKTLA